MVSSSTGSSVGVEGRDEGVWYDSLSESNEFFVEKVSEDGIPKAWWGLGAWGPAE
jgi:hypothetical protein